MRCLRQQVILCLYPLIESVCTAWTAASVPDSWPPQSCWEPTASWMSPLVILSTALAMIRLATSPIPMGRTPGFLLRAIRRQAMSGEMLLGSARLVQRCFATAVRDTHRSLEADLNEVHNLLH